MAMEGQGKRFLRGGFISPLRRALANLSKSTVRRYPVRFSRASCSAMKKAHLPEHAYPNPGEANSRITGHYSSMRLPNSIWGGRARYCNFCRTDTIRELVMRRSKQSKHA